MVDRNQQRTDLRKHVATVAWDAASCTVLFHFFPAKQNLFANEIIHRTLDA